MRAARAARAAVISKAGLIAFLNRRLRRFDVTLIRHSELWRATAELGRQPVAATPPAPARPPLLVRFGPDRARFDVAVVMPTILRPTLFDALRSVFAQDFAGSVQTLVGVDVPRGGAEVVEAACRARPDNHTVLLLDPGYSTSARHGGLHPAWDGGVLRVVLSYLAASRHLAYLDDDNFWAPAHLSSIRAALEGHDYAWAERILIDRQTRALGEKIPFEGFFDPNCLAIDKLACEAVLRWWGLPKRDSRTATDADRNISRTLMGGAFRGRGTGQATVYYAMRPPLPEGAVLED